MFLVVGVGRQSQSGSESLDLMAGVGGQLKQIKFSALLSHLQRPGMEW